MTQNRHIVDELADVRLTIKALEIKETELKAEISKAMGSADSLGGDEYIARQVLTSRKGGLDEKALTAAGVDVDAYRKADIPILSIKVERRVHEPA